MINDWLAIVFGGLIFLVLPVAVLVMAIVAFVRSGRIARLERKIVRLETLVGPLSARQRLFLGEGSGGEQEASAHETGETAGPTVVESESIATAQPLQRPEPIQWEMLIGRRALGWVAVLLVIFAAAFFIRYVVDNDWIGPLGQIALVELAGSALVIAGWRFAHRRWDVFSQMLTAAGIVVLYVATYAAFGFYQLLPREPASAFLVVILLGSVLLALAYDSLAIGLTAVLGGLLTPVLMQSAHDDYPAFFSYLAVLNLAVVVLSLARSWVAIGTVALVGTQGLFWMWYAGNYHPEKLAWALGFQTVVYVLHLGNNLAVHGLRRPYARGEDLVRLVLGAAFAFTAWYVMLRDDPLLWQRAEPWMGTAAIASAALYAIIARGMLAAPKQDAAHLFTALAISVGFIALAFPLQADAAWVALGWAAEGAVLWWFGQRIANGSLRAIAGGLSLAAVIRLVAHDLPPDVREPFVPAFNHFSLPAIGVVFCLLAGVASTRRFVRQRGWAERVFAGGAAAVGVLLLWLVLSFDCYNYFAVRARQPGAPRATLLWLGQMGLSVLWTVYATVVLVIGFRASQSWLRWLALALYGVTVLKVFFVDIRELDEIYRVVAFFVLAVFMGLAAWGYQRLPFDRRDPHRSME